MNKPNTIKIIISQDGYILNIDTSCEILQHQSTLNDTIHVSHVLEQVLTNALKSNEDLILGAGNYTILSTISIVKNSEI